ncbi:TPA: collagenase-like protease, partial [Candidatus Gastranaerophilales bacterium HUM_20]
MITKRKLELLAPAKDKKTAITAIESGADAVYIGSPKFGARQAAGNSLEDIKEIVDYAHKFYVKVHVTINTILTDEELLQALDLINKLYEIGVDAIIVQDMGILKLAVENKLPPIPIHASTQCDTRTLQKAEFFKKLGVSRIILARELSVEQIREICDAVSEKDDEDAVEVETFIHGALCVSYSGQCYMSHYIGGRSANRGECAQACRKKYTLVDEDGNIIAKGKHLLSLKDFNASRHIEELAKAGVKSFKIEGRLKDENYVKNVVLYYRNLLDKCGRKSSSGQVFADFEPDVNKSFNRGFTEYFLKKREKCFNFDTPKAVGEKIGTVTRVGRDFFEIKTKIQLNNQDGLCFMLGGHLEGCLV